MSMPAHITSLLVRAAPATVARVAARIAALDGAEVAIADPGGKIVVTLETDSEAEIVDRLTELQLLDGVVSAALVYHHIEPADRPQHPDRTGGGHG